MRSWVSEMRVTNTRLVHKINFCNFFNYLILFIPLIRYLRSSHSWLTWTIPLIEVGVQDTATKVACKIQLVAYHSKFSILFQFPSEIFNEKDNENLWWHQMMMTWVWNKIARWWQVFFIANTLFVRCSHNWCSMYFSS